MNHTVHSTISMFVKRTAAQEDEEMDSRISPDGMLLQAQLATNETMTIRQIALVVFGESGQQNPTPVQMLRARAAARSLVSMGGATAHPSRREIESVTSTATPGTQTAAVMNLMIKKCREQDAIRAIRETEEGTGPTITPAARIIPHDPAVDEALEEQKARVAASKFPSVHATM